MEQAEPVAEEIPVRSSVEKVRAVFSKVDGQEPETEEDARLLSTFQMVGPMVVRFIPDDPVELDRMLLTLSRWCLQLRSDDAWHPETIEELLFTPIDPAKGGDDDEHPNPDPHENEDPPGLPKGDRGGGDLGG